jgi:hypothetical protein
MSQEDSINNYIIVRRKGGLGNQIFIVAATYAIQQHKSHKINILLAPTTERDNTHLTSKYDYYNTLFSHFPNTYQIDIPQELLGESHHFMYLAQLKQILYESPEEKSYSSWDPSTIHTPCVLEGYFQFYLVIEPHIGDICRFLKKGLTDIRENFLQKYPVLSKGAAFLHVRRGDYVEKYSDHFYTDHNSYYEAALEQLQLSSSTLLFIFSDDIEYCKGLELFKNRNAIFIDEPDEIVSLALMSLCEKGAICANSTFSYWGAMLGTHQAGNKVIVPKNWCKDPPVCLFPDSWLIL